MMNSLVKYLIALYLLAVLLDPGHAGGADLVFLNFGKHSNITFKEPTKKELANPSWHAPATLYAKGLALTLDTDWPIRRIDADSYAIRYKNWSDFYWIIKKNIRQVYQISGRAFGEDGPGQPVTGVEVRVNLKSHTVSLWFNAARFELDVRNLSARYLINDLVILDSQDWEIKEVKSGVFHIRRAFWGRPSSGFFWEFDESARDLFLVKGEAFDQPSKNRQPFR
jgi:hypothetical protein